MPTAKNEVKLKFGDKAKYASAIKMLIQYISLLTLIKFL